MASFLLLQLGLELAIESWLPELRDPEYAYHVRGLRRRLAAVPPRCPVVVFLGSSRTVFGLNAGRLEACLTQDLNRQLVVFNFGLVGAGPLMELLTLRRLLAEGLRPDLVVLEITPPFLAGQPGMRDHEATRLFPGSRLWPSELELLDRYGLCPPERRRDCWQSCLVPWYGHRCALLSRVLPSALPPGLSAGWAWASALDACGWMASMTERVKVDHTREVFTPFFFGFRVGGPPRRALAELLELCRAERIPAALLFMPEGSAFRSWYPPGAWVQVAACVEELSQVFGTPVIDLRDAVADGDFVDAHHMLPHAATQLAERLARDPSFADYVHASLRYPGATILRPATQTVSHAPSPLP